MPETHIAVSGPPQILVVDDEPDMQVLIEQKFRRAIRNEELRFFFAGNGVEALQVLSEEPDISMVISDINMPEMDGLTLLGQLKTLNPNIRSVIVSAYGDLDNIRVAMNRGAFDFLTKPIDFDDFQVTLEKTLAHLQEVREALMDRDRLVSLNHELGIAREIQQNALPHTFPEHSKFQLYGSMNPALSVGGDFFDFFDLPDNQLGLVVGDVSGKGVPAALFMMVCQALVRSNASSVATAGLSPADLMLRINEQLFANNPAMMFVTLFYGVFQPRTGTLTYAMGGHECPLLVCADGRVQQLPNPEGVALGIMAQTGFAEASVEIAPGGALFLYTDGVTDALNPEDQRFGLARLEALLGTQGGLDAATISKNVVQAVNNFAGHAPQEDDLTCLVMSRPA